VPSMMPRPLLRDKFNITYRKIPVLMIGKEVCFTVRMSLSMCRGQEAILSQRPFVHPTPCARDEAHFTDKQLCRIQTYIDTSLICEALEHAFPPASSATYTRAQAQYGTLYPHHPSTPPNRSVIRAIASYWTDRPLFRMTCGLIPSSVWRSPFGADRGGLIGHPLDADKLEAKIPSNISGLDMHLSLLEGLLAEPSMGGGPSGRARKWIMDTPSPSLADIAFYYQLDWGRKIARGYGVENLTAGSVAEGGQGEGADVVLNEARYPCIEAWYGRFKNYFERLPLNETRVDQDDKAGLKKVIDAVAEAEYADPEVISVLPTPAPPHTQLDARNGLVPGTKVSIAPTDTGRGDPSLGTLLAITPEEIVIAPEAIDGRKVDLRLHFPRIEFRVKPL
jgi:glutathione S-transferase